MFSGRQVIAAFAFIGLAGIVGPGSLAVTIPIAKWFIRNRPQAMAWMSIGVPLGTATFVPVSQLLIQAAGWRNAWLILGALGLAVILPLSLLIRRRPEDMGLLPDGDAPGVSATVSRAAAERENRWTVRQATRSAVFWRLVTVFSLVMLANASVGLHRIPHYTDQGIAPGLVSIATSLDALAALVGTLALGRLVARYPSRLVGAGGFALLAFAVFLTINAGTAPMMFVSMITFGFAVGGLLLMQNYIWVDYFGRAHVGSIRGAALPITLLFSAAGPIVAGYVRDATGSYNLIWWCGMCLMLIGAAILATTAAPSFSPGTVTSEPAATIA